MSISIKLFTITMLASYQIIRGRDGIPPVINTTLHVGHYFYAAAPGAASVEYRWVVNSGYDLFQGDADDQPQYFDQYASLYSKAVITRVRFKIAVLSAEGQGMMSMHPQDSSGACVAYTLGELGGMKEAKSCMFTYLRPTVLSGYIDCRAWLNFKKVGDRPTITFNGSGDPTDKLYHDIILRSPDLTTNLGAYMLWVDYWLDTTWFQPGTVAPSSTLRLGEEKEDPTSVIVDPMESRAGVCPLGPTVARAASRFRGKV